MVAREAARITDSTIIIAAKYVYIKT